MKVVINVLTIYHPTIIDTVDNYYKYLFLDESHRRENGQTVKFTNG